MRREEQIGRLTGTYDVLVIGGGATGLGTALDAAARGYSTALVEASDFAKATSSRSTKLVHGGVRYLQNGDVGLVKEALRERTRLRDNAPHLVGELEFILPIYKWFEGPYYLAGLKAYDLLAGRSGFTPSGAIGRSETLAKMPGLNAAHLLGGIHYADGQFDDARLALALARSAVDTGATVVNYARAVRIIYDRGRASGAVVRDLETGVEHEVRAKVVVNATGIFVDEIRRQDDSQAKLLLEHSRGAHVVFAKDVFPGSDALIVPKTDDGRVLFIIPWHGHVVIGTTDIPVTGAALDPAPTRAEIDYMIEHANRYLARPVKRSDALSAFAGLRPLVNRDAASSTAKLSREHLVDVSVTGIVTITGGKWTTYRKMAEDTVDRAALEGGLAKTKSVTAEMPLHGSPSHGDYPRDGEYALYGTDAPGLRALEAAMPGLGTPIDAALPYTRAQVVFAARHEMARTVDDVLSRRTRAAFLDAAASQRAAADVAAILATELGRDEAWRDEQTASFDALLASDVAALGTLVQPAAEQAAAVAG